jgi:hypothetical protein
MNLIRSQIILKGGWIFKDNKVITCDDLFIRKFWENNGLVITDSCYSEKWAIRFTQLLKKELWYYDIEKSEKKIEFNPFPEQ